MDAQFKLDGCHTIRISTDVPRHLGEVGSVGFQIEYSPLRLPGEPVSEGPRAVRARASSNDLPVTSETQILMSTRLRSSEARAMASMLLSAATEGRR